MRIAFPALAMLDVELKVGITAGNLAHSLQRGISQRRASQIGMQDDARGIDDRAQRRLQALSQLALNRLRNSLHRNFNALGIEMSGRDFSTQTRKNAARSIGYGSVAFQAD